MTKKNIHTSNLNVHKSNMLELLTHKQTYTYSTHNSKKKTHAIKLIDWLIDWLIMNV